MKDARKENWPILGICQGLEVLSIIMADDNLGVLDKIVIYGDNLPVTWHKSNTKDSRMFGSYPVDLLHKMETNGVALHAHTYSVSLETYNKTKGLKKEMKVLQTDTWKRPSDGKKIEFIDAMESVSYPMFATMYHPEYQVLDFPTTSPKKWGKAEKETGEQIAFRMSLLLNRYARQNTN